MNDQDLGFEEAVVASIRFSETFAPGVEFGLPSHPSSEVCPNTLVYTVGLETLCPEYSLSILGRMHKAE